MKNNFQKVLKEAQQSWMDIDGVIAVAQGKQEQQDCIDVYVTTESQQIKKHIPSKFQNYPVVFRESGGPFEPQS
jgi:hypothetical protein